MTGATPQQHCQTERTVERVVSALSTLEGGGFPVRRPFPQDDLVQVDPFLLLDHMGPVDWAPGEALGAPDHPHRGFETVTYLLEGWMQHRDSAGRVADLGPGDVQWMTAGSGVIHSELPHPDFRSAGGLMHGFQIWVNLPSDSKMSPPRYQGIPADQIPTAQSVDGRVQVRVIAGASLGAKAVIDTHVPISFLHVTIQAGAELFQPMAVDDNVLVYVFAGHARIGRAQRKVGEGQMALTSGGDALRLAVDSSAADAVELLLLAGRPIGEPVVRQGPFVMNTRDQILQAIRDYQTGRLARGWDHDQDSP